MSEHTNSRPPTAPPKLVVSKPTGETEREISKANVASRRRRAPLPILKSKEHGRSQSSEWVDVDESPERIRKSKRRSSQRHRKGSRASSHSEVRRRSPESEYYPRLSGILEVNESVASSRSSTRHSERRVYRDKSPMRRSRHKDDASSGYHRPSKHRIGGVHRRNESLLKVNPSLLSVLSTLTGNSDRSSGSSSTITQQSYDRRSNMPLSNTSIKSRRALSDIDTNFARRSQFKSPNVFDYMDASQAEDRKDAQSPISSSSSHYEPSDRSSEAPGTPSSRSTFPSPTDTKGQSVSELRRKYDPQYGTATQAISGVDQSPATSVRSLHRQPSVSDVLEGDEDISHPQTAPAESDYDPRRSSSRSSRASRSSRRGSERLHQQEESMRQHVAYTQQQHYVEPMYGQHRSSSYSSAHSDRSTYQYQMAMQQYQWPTPSQMAVPPAPPQAMNGHITPHERPPAPDPPDLTQRTLTGYEMLALELTSPESSVQPLYRKFEYLNHRVLLHLQDELSELEEQLRMLDEVIAQMDPGQLDGHKTPVSRRGEAFHGGDIHYRRTHLLGRIFMKTEQYNKAMSAYASLTKDSSTPEGDEIVSYQQWISKHAPVHEVETRFLQQKQDLVMPGKAQALSQQSTTLYSALPYLPVALILPILLYSIVPSLIGRLIVTALIAAGAFLIAATTSIRHLMAGHEWAICGAVYVLLMAAIAGCIPHHAS